ncbi:MAG: isopentenyl phosphate kinase [Thermoprotei archaeon]
MKHIVVVKIGGSVITQKNTGSLKVNIHTLNRLIDELESSETNLVLVHGGGSFGHTLAKKYSVHKGKQFSSAHAASEVMNSMMRLNSVVVNTMLKKGLSPISFPPHSVLSSTGRFGANQKKLLHFALAEGFIPVTFGDVILDNKLGFKIISGDFLAAELAIILKAKKLVFGTNVDGVLPSLNSNEILLKVNQFTKFSSSSTDVTGGIRYKVRQGLRAARAGVETLIVNASKEGNIKSVITGGNIVCTRIVWD